MVHISPFRASIAAWRTWSLGLYARRAMAQRGSWRIGWTMNWALTRSPGVRRLAQARWAAFSEGRPWTRQPGVRAERFFSGPGPQVLGPGRSGDRRAGKE